MKKGTIFLLCMIAAVITLIVVDRYYISRVGKTFKEIEKQRIITANKLTTAKIVQENLNHVRDLVLENMEIPGRSNRITNETYFFDFITTCMNDLKLKLVSIKPLKPEEKGRITNFGYDIEIEGDFFKFGELCAKLENSRRIISIESFNVDRLATPQDKKTTDGGNKEIAVNMRVNTYLVKRTPVIAAANGIPQKGAGVQ